jgi:hypothetical protein
LSWPRKSKDWSSKPKPSLSFSSSKPNAMPREVLSITLVLTAYLDILDIEKNIHLENQKLTEKTVAQRYSLDYRKREKLKLQEQL